MGVAEVIEFCRYLDADVVRLRRVQERLQRLSGRPVASEADALERQMLWRQLDVLVWIKERRDSHGRA